MLQIPRIQGSKGVNCARVSVTVATVLASAVLLLSCALQAEDSQLLCVRRSYLPRPVWKFRFRLVFLTWFFVGLEILQS